MSSIDCEIECTEGCYLERRRCKEGRGAHWILQEMWAEVTAAYHILFPTVTKSQRSCLNGRELEGLPHCHIHFSLHRYPVSSHIPHFPTHCCTPSTSLALRSNASRDVRPGRLDLPPTFLQRHPERGSRPDTTSNSKSDTGPGNAREPLTVDEVYVDSLE